MAIGYLVSWAPFSNYDVTAGAYHGHTVRIQQLTLAFSAFAKLKFEVTFTVEDLNSVVVGIGDHNVTLGVHGNACKRGVLNRCDAIIPHHLKVR